MKKLLLIPLMIALVGILIFVGCGAPAPVTVTPAPVTPAPVAGPVTTPAPVAAPTPAPAPAGPDTIKLGHIAGLTGMYAGFGTGGEFGVRAAIDDLNAQGGIYVAEYGRTIPVELVVVNSESDPIKAGSLAEDLIVRDECLALVSGHIPPPMMAPVATVCQRYKTPYIHLGNPMEPAMGLRADAAEEWTHVWIGGFAIGTPSEPGSYYDRPGYTIMSVCWVLLSEFGYLTNRKMGIFASDDSDGIGWYGAFGGLLPDQGYDVIGVDKELGLFPMDTTDFTPIIREWMDNDVEIIWGNCPAPPFATLWRQMTAMNYKPQMLYAARAGLFYTDVASWGGDLPWGVGCEGWWDPSYQGVAGFGSTTPQSLTDRWKYETGQPFNPNIGWGYSVVQIMANAIETAGTLDQDQINTAIGQTNMTAMIGHCEFDANQYCRAAIYYFQWEKTDNPWVWEQRIVVSQHDWIPETAEPIWPLP